MPVLLIALFLGTGAASANQEVQLDTDPPDFTQFSWIDEHLRVNIGSTLWQWSDIDGNWNVLQDDYSVWVGGGCSDGLPAQVAENGRWQLRTEPDCDPHRLVLYEGNRLEQSWRTTDIKVKAPWVVWATSSPDAARLWWANLSGKPDVHSQPIDLRHGRAPGLTWLDDSTLAFQQGADKVVWVDLPSRNTGIIEDFTEGHLLCGYLGTVAGPLVLTDGPAYRLVEDGDRWLAERSIGPEGCPGLRLPVGTGHYLLLDDRLQYLANLSSEPVPLLEPGFVFASHRLSSQDVLAVRGTAGNTTRIAIIDSEQEVVGSWDLTDGRWMVANELTTPEHEVPGIAAWVVFVALVLVRPHPYDGDPRRRRP